MLRLLSACYYPFVALVFASMAGAIFYLANLIRSQACFAIIGGVVIIMLVIWFFHLLIALRFLFQNEKPKKNPLEIKLPKESVVAHWVRDIAQENSLTPPDEIRLSAESLAHVYESDKGRNVLVIGAMAVGTLSKLALGGIVAHELAHFTHGDTAFSKSMSKKWQLMTLMEYGLFSAPAGQLNPFAWLVVGYHRLFFIYYFKNSREQEFAADRWEVAHSGKEIAAATLIHICVTEKMPWVKLTNIAESSVVHGQLGIRDIFEEQMRRAKAAPLMDWERILKKEMQQKTALFDSHPCLKERLEAIGVSSKKALKIALETEGEPAMSLFPSWPSLQAELSQKLSILALQRQQEIQEIGQILRS